jgi:hypothetical protein
MILRYGGLIILILLVIGFAYAIFIYDSKKKIESGNAPVVNKNTPKAISNHAKAVRQLDTILNDPYFGTSDEWREESQEIVQEYYNK